MVAVAEFPMVPGEGWQIVRLKLSLLVMDRYQRPIDLAQVRQISRNFKPELCDPLVVNRRTDGTLACVDGQHRAKSLIAAFGPDVTWPCRLTEGMTYQDEAKLFYQLNQFRKQVSVVDRFWAAYEASDPEAIEIKNTVERWGYRLVTRNHTGATDAGTITAVGALLYVNRRYADRALDDTLRFISESFGVRPAPAGTTIRGISGFFSEYRDLIDMKRLRTVVQRLTLSRLEAESSDMRRVFGATNDRAVVMVLHKHYNHGLTAKGRLPERGSKA